MGVFADMTLFAWMLAPILAAVSNGLSQGCVEFFLCRSL